MSIEYDDDRFSNSTEKKSQDEEWTQEIKESTEEPKTKYTRKQVKSIREKNADEIVETSTRTKNKVREEGAVPRENDVRKLRELADTTVVNAFVDTLAQDIASTNFKIQRKDEKDSDSEKLSEIKKEILNIHSHLDWNEVAEKTAKSILKSGDQPWVFTEKNQIKIPDIATMRKTLDSKGQVDGYVQAPFYSQNIQKPIHLDTDEVAWFSWSTSDYKIYGESPVEKSIDNIRILDEIYRKELADLEEGSMSGLLYLSDSSEISEEEFQDIKDDLTKKEGKRHIFGVTKGDWNWQDISSNYQELQLLDRAKHHITEISSVFKVNPSYAGFEFENVNRATDESQRQSYQERGFEYLVDIFERKINKEVLPKFGYENYQIEFEIKKTIEDKNEKVKYYKNMAEAAEMLKKIGANVKIKDEKIILDDCDEIQISDVSEQDLNSLEDLSEMLE